MNFPENGTGVCAGVDQDLQWLPEGRVAKGGASLQACVQHIQQVFDELIIKPPFYCTCG